MLLCAVAVSAQSTKSFEEARKAYEKAAEAEDVPRLVQALGELARWGLISDDDREKKVARSALKRGLRHDALEVRVAAARGYGVLRLPGSSRDLKRCLRVKKGEPTDVAKAALESWGLIHDPGSHKDVLERIKDVEDDPDARALAKAAAACLRGYRALETRRRAQVMDDMMKVFRRIWSLAHKRAREGSPAVLWWNAVEQDMVKTCNALSARYFTDYYECAEWWQRNRRDMLAAR